MASKKVDLKVVMLGRQSVGKSALVERFANERWNPSLTSTIGGSFLAKAVHIEGKDGQTKTVTLGVWDTAGSERYESLTRHYFNLAECAFVCFDLTELASWQKVDFWIQELHKVEPQCRVYVLGCKSDLVQPNQGTQAAPSRGRGATHGGGGGSSSGSGQQRARCVSREDVSRYCASVQPEPAIYFETSALTGSGISAPFEQACRDWAARPKKEFDYMRQGAVSLDDHDDRRRKKGMLATCCNQ